jgi:hypothetical protein
MKHEDAKQCRDSSTVTLQARQVVISKTKKKNQTKKKKAQKQRARVNSTCAAYSAVSTRLPTTPTPSTCFSNNCTFSLSSSNLCFSSIHRISRRSYRLPSACKLPIAVSSARRRSSSRASLLLEEIHRATTKRPARVVRVAMTSARRGGGARPVRQRQIGCPSACPSTRAGSCRSGPRATLRNVAYPC